MGNVLRLLVVVPLGFVAAVVAGALVLVARELGSTGDPFLDGVVMVRTIAILNVVGSVAFFPALTAILIAELFSLRSALYWIAVGGLIGLIPRLIAAPAEAAGFFDLATTQMLAAGFAGALSYWLIAGRLSGGEVREPET